MLHPKYYIYLIELKTIIFLRDKLLKWSRSTIQKLYIITYNAFEIEKINFEIFNLRY